LHVELTSIKRAGGAEGSNPPINPGKKPFQVAGDFWHYAGQSGGVSMRSIHHWPALLALIAAAGGCASIPMEAEQSIAFEFKQAGTQCEVKRGPEALGKVSGPNASLKVQKHFLPLDLDCTGKNTRLQAQVKPGGEFYKYPDKVTIDMAAKKVAFTDTISAQQQPGAQPAVTMAAPAAGQPAVQTAATADQQAASIPNRDLE
jgi:hypothetical protein